MQHDLKTIHKKKLVWDKTSQGMADGGYSRTVSSVAAVSDGVSSSFSSSDLRSFLCLSSGLHIKYCGEYHGSCLIGRHFVFKFRLRGYPA